MNTLDFGRMKIEKRPITMVTCYDYPTARVVAASEIDAVLVGDSVAMVVHGHDSTLAADVPMIALHTAAVARGLRTRAGSHPNSHASRSKFLVADMPFLSFRKGPVEALDCVDALMKAGANAVKLEGVDGHEDVIERIVGSGVPVMGHLGLTPQSVHQLGGYRVQGRGDEGAAKILKDAQELERLGCFAVVLECVPRVLAAEITRELGIPTIGIGAGAETDGQVLVLHDLLGLNTEFKPRFVRRFGNEHETILVALNRYHAQSLAREFPSTEESYE